MSVLHDWAKTLKAKTDAGALMSFDDEMIIRPKWLISKERVAMKIDPTTTYSLWDRSEGDTPEEALAELKPRIRIFKEV